MARFISSLITTETSRRSITAVYNVPGANTWTVPVGVTCATFELWGAGGGGGARCCCDCYHQGSGGGSGRYAAASLCVTPGTVYSLCIGCGYLFSSGACHNECLGPAGQTTYVTGTGITTLCAGGGNSGNNDCYTYCMCSACCTGCQPKNECVSLSGISYPNGTFTCMWNKCNVDNGTGANKAASGMVGLWSDAQAFYYASASAALPWRSAKVLTTNRCTTNYISRTEVPGWYGQGGDGAFANQCCCCIQAGTGAHGLILIRY